MATQKKEVSRPQPYTYAMDRMSAFLMPVFIDLMFFVHVLTYLRIAPFTKVEESFNLHAVHDILMYGVGSDVLHKYDHFTFPGVVPRTFIGSVLLAWLVKPAFWVGGWHQSDYLKQFHPKMQLQIIIRLNLLALNCFGLRAMRVAIDKRFGRQISLIFGLLSVSQFHLPFWMGRTLPNMFALFPVTLAFSLLIDQPKSRNKPSTFNINAAIALLTATTVIFRAEVFLLLIPIALQALYLRHITFTNLVLVGLVSGLASLCLTVTVDSYFWGRPYVWPEFHSIFFNVYQGKSAEWGTSPPHAYFTTHLPKLLLLSFPLSIISFFIDKRIRTLLLPCIAFLALMSCLPHKEWRFVVYVIPMFTLGAARVGDSIVFPPEIRRPFNPIRYILLPLLFLGLIYLSTMIKSTLGSLPVENYPGGKAMVLFHETYPSDYITPLGTPPHVHICNLAAQTGASLFMQFNAPPYHTPFLKSLSSPSSNSTSTSNSSASTAKSFFSFWSRNSTSTSTSNTSTSFRLPPQPWIYDKTENLSIHDLTRSKLITHLISEVGPGRWGGNDTGESGSGSEEDVETEMQKEWRMVVPIKTRSKIEWKPKFGWEALRVGWDILKGERGELCPWVEEERLWIYERRWEGVEEGV